MSKSRCANASAVRELPAEGAVTETELYEAIELLGVVLGAGGGGLARPLRLRCGSTVWFWLPTYMPWLWLWPVEDEAQGLVK